MRLTVTINGAKVYDAAAATRDDQASRVRKGASEPGAGGKGKGLWPNYWRKKRGERLKRQKDKD